MLKLLIPFILLSGFCFSQSDSKNKTTLNPSDAAKIAVGKQKMYAGDYVAALNVFREVEKNNSDNGSVNFYLGYCYFYLKQMANASSNLEKAVNASNIIPESFLYLGRVYQAEQKFDLAISKLETYVSQPKADKFELEEARIVLSQCRNAKQFMAAPLDVQVINLGADVNSKWDDKNPCITADGARLVFTTRRPETTNSPVDVEGDNKYFEDIYLAQRDSATQNFGKAMPVSSNINVKGHDAVTGITADGKQIFIYYNTATGNGRGGNLFVSKVADSKWKTPEDLGKPINSSYWEGGVCLSPDGKKYFFTSERKGGFGLSDIWMVEKKGKNEWGKPENLGPEINSANDEGGVFLAPDGKTLFFCSNGPSSMGGYDVFRTHYENGKWSKPENLGFPVNTPAHEGQMTISADARYAYISSNREGGLGESDLYKVDLRNYAILEKDGKRKNASGLGILRGTIREGTEGYGVQDVEVVVKSDADQIVASTATGETGEYFLTLPAGSYKLEIRKNGYATIMDTFELPLDMKETPKVEKGYLFKKTP